MTGVTSLCLLLFCCLLVVEGTGSTRRKCSPEVNDGGEKLRRKRMETAKEACKSLGVVSRSSAILNLVGGVDDSTYETCELNIANFIDENAISESLVLSMAEACGSDYRWEEFLEVILALFKHRWHSWRDRAINDLLCVAKTKEAKKVEYIKQVVSYADVRWWDRHNDPDIFKDSESLLEGPLAEVLSLQCGTSDEDFDKCYKQVLGFYEWWVQDGFNTQAAGICDVTTVLKIGRFFMSYDQQRKIDVEKREMNVIFTAACGKTTAWNSEVLQKTLEEMGKVNMAFETVTAFIEVAPKSMEAIYSKKMESKIQAMFGEIAKCKADKACVQASLKKVSGC